MRVCQHVLSAIMTGGEILYFAWKFHGNLDVFLLFIIMVCLLRHEWLDFVKTLSGSLLHVLCEMNHSFLSINSILACSKKKLQEKLLHQTKYFLI